MTDQQKPVKTIKDLVQRIRTPDRIEVEFGSLSRGLDNYHVDVQLSPAFVLHVGTIADDQVERIVNSKSLLTGNTEQLDRLRDLYLDMMTATLHRCKTDVSPAELAALQFAPVKYVIQTVRKKLDAVVLRLEEALAQQQFSGSRNTLATQSKFAHFRKHRTEYQYRVCRILFRQLHRVEVNQLRDLRGQLLGDQLPESVNILFNPMLSAARPDEACLLMDNYALWVNGQEGFVAANTLVESTLAEAFDTHAVRPLRQEAGGDAEVYDELGGLFATQALLGRAVDQGATVSETFTWPDMPSNIEMLFDGTRHEVLASEVKDTAGYRSWWTLRGELKKLARLGGTLVKALGGDVGLRQLAAGRLMRERWSISMSQLLEIEDAAAYVGGVDQKRIIARIDRSMEGASKFIDFLSELDEAAGDRSEDSEDELSLQLLMDYSRYRMHLKYFRLAHRVFNRLTVRTSAEDIESLKSAGSLYQMLGADENRANVNGEPLTIHHAIIKADVRGSTTVTSELLAKGLNPASYFSERFFGSINAILSEYGASKVFVEGDAVILSIIEQDTHPEQWFAVSRACGVARAMLEIVNAKNAHSRQTGLPSLELGIGIAYRDDRPLFLRDGATPIMISPAIGDADRLSSCSWKLRDMVEAGGFSVEVFEIAEEGPSQGEKGQSHLRYNVGGILLDKPAFRKLMAEVSMKKFSIKINERFESLLVGKYPDTRGKERDIVIREGKVGSLRGDTVVPGGEDAEVFHEVVTNARITSHVLGLARRQ